MKVNIPYMDPMGTIVTVLMSALMFQQMSFPLNSSSVGKLPGAWYSQSRGQSTIECVEVPQQWESDDPVILGERSRSPGIFMYFPTQ